jgi:hypothetical protein
MPAIIHTTSDDIDEENRRVRLKYPGMPPGRTSEHKRPPSPRTFHAIGVRKVVSRRCILGIHTPVSGGHGFETELGRDGGRIHTGPNIGNPG